MNLIKVLILVAIAVYMANVLGCLVLCETIPEMDFMRKYAWCIPIINVSVVFYIVLGSSDDHKVSFLWNFLKMPHKNIAAIKVLAHTLEKETAEQKGNTEFCGETKNYGRHANMLRDSVKVYGAVFSMD